MIWCARHHAVSGFTLSCASLTASSAPTISDAEPKRSPGAFRKQRAITSATPLGTSGARPVNGRASLSSTRATVASAVDAANGCVPHAYSYSVTPITRTRRRARRPGRR